MENLGESVLPVVICIILVFGFIKGIDVFDTFLKGAKEGVTQSIRILPTLIGLIMAVSMLRASGLLDMLCELFIPIADFANISPQILPLAILRPISGSGSTAYTMSLMETFGPDSETGRIASVLSSSTETTFYAIAVYFGVTRYKKLYYTIPISLIGDFCTVVVAVLSVKYI